jgi:hypothetical protein
MDLEHWYRCNVCGYMYTPQQVQALVHLLSSRLGSSDAHVESAVPDAIPCRKKGCGGFLQPTDQLHQDPRR